MHIKINKSILFQSRRSHHRHHCHQSHYRDLLYRLLAGDRWVTGGVLNITAAAWTAGFQWWRSTVLAT